MIFTITATSFAQDGALTHYENALFAVDVPDWLSVAEEGDDYAVFEGSEASLSIRAAAATTSTDAILNSADDSLSAAIALMFADSGYEAGACAATTVLSCAEFTDTNTDGSVSQITTLYDATAGSIFTFNFSAASADVMAQLAPEAIIESFGLMTGLPAAGKGETLFNVVANGNVNLRACAETTCDLVGQASNGQVLAVLGEEGDWYKVEWEDGIAYIAGWLTSRGPDVYVDLVDEYYTDPKTGCSAMLRLGRGDGDLDIAIFGDRQDDVWVDIYRPNESRPLDVDGQYDKTFIDTDEPYIHQFYYWSTWWPTGTYQLELALDGQSSMIAFDIDQSGGHTLYVECN